jgi:hypothetical protein
MESVGGRSAWAPGHGRDGDDEEVKVTAEKIQVEVLTLDSLQ